MNLAASSMLTVSHPKSDARVRSESLRAAIVTKAPSALNTDAVHFATRPQPVIRIRSGRLYGQLFHIYHQRASAVRRAFFILTVSLSK